MLYSTTVLQSSLAVQDDVLNTDVWKEFYFDLEIVSKGPFKITQTCDLEIVS